jgi:hypothetical protein
MRSASLSLGFLLLFGGACSQIIGLSDYENTDSTAGLGGDGQTGGASSKGGSGGVTQGGRGGTSSGGRNTTGADAGAGGVSGGEGGTSGSSGAGPEGGVGAQGAVGNAGGEGGEAGTATGGTSTGGTLNTGGTASGGTLNTAGTASGGTLNTGGAGKGATGGTAGGSGGKGGSGGTTGGAGGKGGTGGTTGGAGGKGGTGGTGGMTCTTTDMLLNSNPSFDNSTAAPPDPAPWTQDSTAGTVVINRQTFLSNAGITAHTAGNAAWLGGVGADYTFEDTKGGTGEVYVLDLALTIPVGTTAVTLSCYYQSQTDETTATIPTSRDKLIAWLWDYTSDESAFTFQRWTPANTSAGWHLFTNTASGGAATALAGRALSLEFYSEVDSTLASDFFIDTCTFKVTVCN